jgi:hypothetical protein
MKYLNGAVDDLGVVVQFEKDLSRSLSLSEGFEMTNTYLVVISSGSEKSFSMLRLTANLK